jgi:hypothetical protein
MGTVDPQVGAVGEVKQSSDGQLPRSWRSPSATW